ncbi:MAG: UTP--glucose-1-phosphate uridylyltransferase [bacterium]
MTKTISKAIVPAAGLGTRLLPATKSQPKEMLPVGRKPILQYVIEELQKAELKQILIITGRRKRAIEDHFDQDPDLISALKKSGEADDLAELDYAEEKVCFFYTRQSVQKGLGHAISLGAEFADDEDFAVALGDSLICASDPASVLRSMIEVHKNLNAAAIVAVEKVPKKETHHYGIVSLKGAESPPGQPTAMVDIIEKPTPATAPSTLAVAARYIFNPDLFEALSKTPPDKHGEIQLTDAIKKMIQMGLPVYAWPLKLGERRYDIGNFESYFKTFVDFCIADEDLGHLMRNYIKQKAHEL